MVLDHYREKTVRGSVEGAANGKRRLESAVQNNNKTIKRLLDPGTRPRHMETNKTGRVLKSASTRYNRKDEDDNDDDEDMSMASTCDEAEESPEESVNEDTGSSLSEMETVRMSKRRKVVSKRKKLSERTETKKKNPLANPKMKVKRSKFEFATEPMDVSEEDEDERVIQREYAKCRPNPRNLSRKEMAIIKAVLKKRKKALAVKVQKKPKKAKVKAPSRKRVSKKRKRRNEIDEENSPCNANCEKSGHPTEQKSGQEGMQNENNGGDNTSNYNTENADKKGNSVGDTRNLNNEKAAAEEKKAATAANKTPGHADVTAKASKDNEKNEVSKDPKAKENVEDLSKKVDQKEIKDMDGGVAMSLSVPRATRLHKSKYPSMKMVRMSSGKPPKRLSPFIKFYMTVYRELCDSRSIRAIAKETARRWNGMATEEKKKFYTKKLK